MSHVAPRRARVFVLTVSDTRCEADDSSGALCRELITAAGHEVTGRAIVPDEPDRIAELCRGLADRGEADAVVINGGTGISPRDRTHEAIAGVLERRLDGFGELFRMLSFAEIGARAMASRALAGVRGRTLLFALPGSPRAVRLGVEKLVAPELGHLVAELHR